MTNQWESEHHEVISQPIGHPEMRRLTPSEDVESETDDLHLWYTTRGSEMRQSSVNSKINEHSSGNGTTDAKCSFDTNFDELESENGANDAIFSEKSNESGQISSMHSPSDQIEGETGRNEAVFAPKLTINHLESETGQIEAVHPENCSEAAKAQHLHDSTVTTISFKGENDPIEVENHSHSGKFGSENGSDRFLLQNRRRIGEFGSESSISDQFLPQNSKNSEFGSENGISDQFQQKFTQNHELGPENSISGLLGVGIAKIHYK